MVASTELQRIGTNGWRAGLANLLGKENRAWWASRRWLVHIVVWTVIVNGITALMMFGLAPKTGSDVLAVGLDMLFKLGGVAVAVGAVILVHDATIGERQLGVTEWLLSKPVSRPAYVLSKLFAHSFAALVLLVGVQFVLAYGLIWVATGQQLPLGPYLTAVVGVAVNTLFYLTLTLMLGVLTNNRIALLGIALGLTLLGFLVVPLGAAVSSFAMFTPFALIQVLGAVVMGQPLPLSIWLLIGITAVLSAIFVAVTLARFERMEF